jgi:hypothetical protein
MRTLKIGGLGAVPAVAAALVLGHGALAAADPIGAGDAAIAASHARAAAGGLPRVLCRVSRSRVTGRVRPKRCQLVSRRHASQGAVRLMRLRWKRWTAKRGEAAGVAAGGLGRTRVRVALRRPVRGCRGRVFSRAVLRSRIGVTRFALRTRCAAGGGQQPQPGGQTPGGAQPPGGGGQPGGGPQPGGGGQPGGGTCVGQDDEAVEAGDGGSSNLDPALFGITFTLDASLDGIDDDGTLPLDIGAVCGVPANLASAAAALAGLSGVALVDDETEVWACDGSAEEAGDGASGCGDIPDKGGTLLQGDAATSALDGADTAFVGVRLVPRSAWGEDEDGEPVPTFQAYWVKVTD